MAKEKKFDEEVQVVPVDEEGKEIAKQEARFVSGPKGQASGLEDIDMQTDIRIPRVAILQGLSRLVSEGKGQVGDLTNALTGEIIGKTFDFIPLFVFKSRVKFIVGQGSVCMSRNALTSTFGDEENGGYPKGTNCIECQDAAWHGQEAPLCSMVYNFLSLNAENLNEFPIVLSCMKSATKEAKTLLSMIAFTGEDSCARIYRMKTEKKENEKGVFFLPKFELVRRVTAEEYQAAKMRRDALREKSIEVEFDSEEDFTAE